MIETLQLIKAHSDGVAAILKHMDKKTFTMEEVGGAHAFSSTLILAKIVGLPQAAFEESILPSVLESSPCLEGIDLTPFTELLGD